MRKFGTWWDNPNIEHRIIPSQELVKKYPHSLELLSLSREIGSLKDIQGIILEPNNAKVEILILLGDDSRGGFITGGAASIAGDSAICERAGAELLRHALAVKRMRESAVNGDTFYQKRLAFFGFGKGKELVLDRLNAKGKERIILPSLKFDESIEHRNSDLVFVHRCLFENQPPFIGGKIERLCI